MNNILKNAHVSRTLPDWRAVRLASRVPIKILRQARDVSSNVSDEMYFTMLDSIGIDPICDLVSQGCFAYDVATTLDIPPTKFREWLANGNDYLIKLEEAEKISAEAYLSTSTNLVMEIGATDVDGAKVAKMKADHLKWLASMLDQTKYGKTVKHQHSGEQVIEYRITLSSPTETQNVIDVNP